MTGWEARSKAAGREVFNILPIEERFFNRSTPAQDG
jgi:hypothetical protein